jgi:hypothetical protein
MANKRRQRLQHVGRSAGGSGKQVVSASGGVTKGGLGSRDGTVTDAARIRGQQAFDASKTKFLVGRQKEAAEAERKHRTDLETQRQKGQRSGEESRERIAMIAKGIRPGARSTGGGDGAPAQQNFKVATLSPAARRKRLGEQQGQFERSLIQRGGINPKRKTGAKLRPVSTFAFGAPVAEVERLAQQHGITDLPVDSRFDNAAQRSLRIKIIAMSRATQNQQVSQSFQADADRAASQVRAGQAAAQSPADRLLAGGDGSLGQIDALQRQLHGVAGAPLAPNFGNAANQRLAGLQAQSLEDAAIARRIGAGQRGISGDPSAGFGLGNQVDDRITAAWDAINQTPGLSGDDFSQIADIARRPLGAVTPTGTPVVAAQPTAPVPPTPGVSPTLLPGGAKTAQGVAFEQPAPPQPAVAPRVFSPQESQEIAAQQQAFQNINQVQVPGDQPPAGLANPALSAALSALGGVVQGGLAGPGSPQDPRGTQIAGSVLPTTGTPPLPAGTPAAGLPNPARSVLGGMTPDAIRTSNAVQAQQAASQAAAAANQAQLDQQQNRILGAITGQPAAASPGVTQTPTAPVAAPSPQPIDTSVVEPLTPAQANEIFLRRFPTTAANEATQLPTAPTGGAGSQFPPTFAEQSERIKAEGIAAAMKQDRKRVGLETQKLEDETAQRNIGPSKAIVDSVISGHTGDWKAKFVGDIPKLADKLAAEVKGMTPEQRKSLAQFYATPNQTDIASLDARMKDLDSVINTNNPIQIAKHSLFGKFADWKKERAALSRIRRIMLNGE